MCLRRGHISRACSSTSKCPKCHGRHHVSICSKNQESQAQPNEAQSPTPAPKEPTPASVNADKNHSLLVHPGLNPEAPAYSPITHTSLWVNSGRTILLQTACAQVANPRRPHLSKQVRIVFDSGSQRSYITEKLRDELRLATEDKGTMTIMTFGSVDEQPKTCELVKPTLLLKNGHKFSLSLFIPLICEPIDSYPSLRTSMNT